MGSVVNNKAQCPPCLEGSQGKDRNSKLAYSEGSVVREVAFVTSWINLETSHSPKGEASAVAPWVWHWVRLQSPGWCRPLFDGLFLGSAINLPICRLVSLFSEVPWGVSCFVY